MPSQIVNAAAIRASGYSIRGYASFFTGRTPVAEGTLIVTPGYPAQDIGTNTPYDVGAYTDLAYGMEVTFHDPVTDAFKGRTHLRYAGVINTSNFPVREFSKAKLNLEAGDVFKVYKDWRIHDKLVAAISTFDPDYLGYTDQGSNPPPVACSGGHWAGKLDAGQVYATVLMTGNTSYTVDPDSGGSLSHLWTLPTGVTFAPGSANTDANPTLRVTAGEYLVSHAVTDSSNSKATIQHVQLKAHDLIASPPHRILYTPDTATADSGFGGTVQLVSGLSTQAAIPDGTFCIVWDVEYVNGQLVSYRNTSPGRSHILCVGIVRGDSQSGASDGSRKVTFEIISPLERLKEITSYSKVMLDNATPDAWNKVKTLGVKRAIIQLIQFYTTLIEAGFDLIFDSAFIDYRYPALFLQRSTFFGQALELAGGVDARVVSDRSGRLNLHTDPKYIPLGARAAITKTWNLLPRDILSFDFPREHVDSVEQLKASGFTGGASANQPVFSLYPGAASGQGADTPVKERLIVTDQDDLNARTGRYGAAADVVFQDADGLLYRAFPLTLTLRGVYDFFDFSKEYVDFTTTLPDLARDVDLTKFLFCLASTSVSYDELGSAITTCVFDVVTNAAPGETFTPKDETQAGYSPSDGTPSQPPLTLPTGIGGLVAGSGRWAIPNINGMFYVTTDAHTPAIQGGPTYIEIDPGLGGALMLDCIQDPYMTSRFVLLTDEASNGIYTFDDILGAATLTQRTIAFQAAITDLSLQNRHIEADFSAGYIRVVSYYNNDAGNEGSWATESTDNGETWSAEVQLTNDYSTQNGTNENGLHVSSHVANRYYVGVFTASGTGVAATGEIYRYDAGVATPTGVSLDNSMAYCLHFPFNNNSSESEFYFSTADFAEPIATRGGIFRRNGAVTTDITPVIGGNTQRLLYNRSLHTCPIDSNYVAAAVAGNTTFGVVLSKNRGATWAYPVVGSTVYTFAEVDGVNRNVVYLCGEAGAVGFVQDFATIDDRSGNIPADFTPGRNLRIYGI